MQTYSTSYRDTQNDDTGELIQRQRFETAVFSRLF